MKQSRVFDPAASPGWLDALHRLVEKWRAEHQRINAFHATRWTGWRKCADELETALADVQQALQNQQARGPIMGDPEFHLIADFILAIDWDTKNHHLQLQPVREAIERYRADVQQALEQHATHESRSPDGDGQQRQAQTAEVLKAETGRAVISEECASDADRSLPLAGSEPADSLTPPAARAEELSGTPFTVSVGNIVDVLTRRFGKGDPGSGLVLNVHEAHVLIAYLHAARRLEAQQEATEERIIQDVVAHWFTQGGQAEFGALSEYSSNADGVVAAILSVVRGSLAPADSFTPPQEQALEAHPQGWQPIESAPPVGSLAPLLRDDGRQNRPHEYKEDPETQCCIVCGWVESVHVWSEPADSLTPPAALTSKPELKGIP